MTTSAEQLNILFSQVTASRKNDERFLSLAAEVLGLEGADREIVVLSQFRKLIGEMNQEIEELECTEEQRTLLKRYAKPFHTLFDFTHAHVDLKAAKGNFLKADNLVNLTNIHFALSAKFDRPRAAKDTSELVGDFRTLKKQIIDTDLSPRIQKAITIRLDHIISILEHSHFFGPDDLKNELDNLVGSIVIDGASAGKKGRDFFGKLAAACVVGYAALGVTDEALKKISSIKDNASALVEELDLNINDKP